MDYDMQVFDTGSSFYNVRLGLTPVLGLSFLGLYVGVIEDQLEMVSRGIAIPVVGQIYPLVGAI